MGLHHSITRRAVLQKYYRAVETTRHTLPSNWLELRYANTINLRVRQNTYATDRVGHYLHHCCVSHRRFGCALLS
jgi:leucyl-tRNA synthetase